jgi:Fic family protein
MATKQQYDLMDFMENLEPKQHYNLVIGKPGTIKQLVPLISKFHKQFLASDLTDDHQLSWTRWNAIEGTWTSLSMDSLSKSRSETLSLYDTLEKGNIPVDYETKFDIEERATVRHLKAITFANQKFKEPITEELIREIHKIVVGSSTGSMGEPGGEYRQNSIYIGGLNCPAWELVPSLMKQLVEWINKGPSGTCIATRSYWRFQ